MTFKFQISVLTITIWLTNVIISCGQSPKTKIDTLETAVLPVDQILTETELQAIDSLFIACVDDHNNSLGENQKELRIDLNKYEYKKQLLVSKTKEGNKIVWVNCLCRTWSKINWKKEIVTVNDG